ncbi:MAG TPA: ferritin [Candidatus Dietzia intestinipullorum]|nr:ferritin [Candidatus Dietzia intestinipullorum]
MKLNDDLEAKFNAQITLEFEASLVYRQLAIEMDLADLPGMATWLRRQADEEIVHANKFIDHLDARGNHPKIGDVSAGEVAPSQDPKQTFKTALHHEQRVSESIRELYRACSEAGDIDSNQLLNWFMSEQIEEEATVDEIVGRLEMTGDDGPGLLRLDAELGKRPQSGTEN